MAAIFNVNQSCHGSTLSHPLRRFIIKNSRVLSPHHQNGAFNSIIFIPKVLWLKSTQYFRVKIQSIGRTWFPINAVNNIIRPLYIFYEPNFCIRSSNIFFYLAELIESWRVCEFFLKSLKIASAASIPVFMALWEPLTFATFRNPAEQPASIPPGNVSFGIAW